MFKSVDGRTLDWNTISSPWAFGSGELKMPIISYISTIFIFSPYSNEAHCYRLFHTARLWDMLNHLPEDLEPPVLAVQET